LHSSKKIDLVGILWWEINVIFVARCQNGSRHSHSVEPNAFMGNFFKKILCKLIYPETNMKFSEKSRVFLRKIFSQFVTLTLPIMKKSKYEKVVIVFG